MVVGGADHARIDDGGHALEEGRGYERLTHARRSEIEHVDDADKDGDEEVEGINDGELGEDGDAEAVAGGAVDDAAGFVGVKEAEAEALEFVVDHFAQIGEDGLDEAALNEEHGDADQGAEECQREHDEAEGDDGVLRGPLGGGLEIPGKAEGFFVIGGVVEDVDHEADDGNAGEGEGEEEEIEGKNREAAEGVLEGEEEGHPAASWLLVAWTGLGWDFRGSRGLRLTGWMPGPLPGDGERVYRKWRWEAKGRKQVWGREVEVPVMCGKMGGGCDFKRETRIVRFW